MTLYTFYQENDKVVYGTFAEGKTQFFYSGFSSAEEAKKATFDSYMAYKLAKSKPNAHGMMPPISMYKAEINAVLSGKWSEIQ